MRKIEVPRHTYRVSVVQLQTYSGGGRRGRREEEEQKQKEEAMSDETTHREWP